ncbi:MAG: molybdopterin oxidoreductase family protein [Deltaproteobacteria bacterium]|nr:molybdopterin oxidoreductase family protein [Deltaproteobacteria bacterium]
MATHLRTCPLCEATCGLVVETEGRAITSVRGDADDPFSRGYICPKAYGVKALSDDPDRLRAPLVRTDAGLAPATWDDAFATALARLAAIRKQHGNDAVAIYIGNPGAHSLDLMLYGPALIRALGTKQRYSASSADQLPKMVSAGLMFGGGLTIPVPDVDRTDHLLILGANPRASNGSLMTAPDIGGRLDAIRARGGTVIVLDPRRSETAAAATEHHFIRPGTDALFLLAIVHVLFAEDLVRLGAVADHVKHLDEIRAIAQRFAPERVASATGIAADTIRRLARAHAAAPSAACYGRIGTTCQEFGTLASWAVDLVNILTGNLDRPGGAMFTTPAALPGRHRPRADVRFGRFTSTARGLPEMFGELPIATLADEIEAGTVKALITIAGNPLSSAPNAARLSAAVASLEFRLAIDPYVNETTRLADVILPPPGPLERASYDVALYQLAVRNVAKFVPALPPPDGTPAEWEILVTLAKGAMGMGAAPIAMADDAIARELVKRELDGAGLAVDTNAALAALGDRRGPARLMDFLIRTGPYGDRFGEHPDGLTLASLLAQPHGVDLGPLVPGVPQVIRTGDAKIDLAPTLITDDLARLEAAIDRAPSLVLIGRRHLRSNNSWMHNLPALVKGPARCTLLIHPSDAAHHGLTSGGRAELRGRVGAVVAQVEISDEMMPGVVSLPHGFGHDQPGMRTAVATAHAGVNVNLVSDDLALDVPSANAAFNGVPVTLARVDA